MNKMNAKGATRTQYIDKSSGKMYRLRRKEDTVHGSRAEIITRDLLSTRSSG